MAARDDDLYVPFTKTGDLLADLDAAHIVRCVNAHDELVAALSDILEYAEQRFPDQDWTRADLARIARAALARVKELEDHCTIKDASCAPLDHRMMFETKSST